MTMFLPFCPYFPLMLWKVVFDRVIQMFFHHSCRDLIHVRIRWLEVFLQEIFDVFVRNCTICWIPLMHESLDFHRLLLYIAKEYRSFQE